MKLFYIANIRLPTEKAHGIQIMKTCEALADNGIEVELVVPSRNTHIKDDPFTYYGVKNNFKITKLWCLDTVRFGWLGYWIESVTFVERCIWYLLFKKGTFFTRDEFPAFCLKSLGKKVVWETHMGQKNIVARLLVMLKVPIIAISNGLRDLYIKFDVSAEMITVIPDGVDMAQFDIIMSKEEARAKLGADNKKNLAVYIGSLYAWKGVDTLEKARGLLPEDVEIKMVSGRPYDKMPLYLKMADVLIVPNSALENASKVYTSPMKLFEYMASGRPIVASDVPSLREVIDESTVLFFEADNPKSLVNSINEIFDNYSAAEKRAAMALEKVREYTWHKRAVKIINFIND